MQNGGSSFRLRGHLHHNNTVGAAAVRKDLGCFSNIARLLEENLLPMVLNFRGLYTKTIT